MSLRTLRSHRFAPTLIVGIAFTAALVSLSAGRWATAAAQRSQIERAEAVSTPSRSYRHSPIRLAPRVPIVDDTSEIDTGYMLVSS